MSDLTASIRSAIFDPGKYATRFGVGHAGFDAESPEPLHVWQARAVAAALASELGERAANLISQPWSRDRYIEQLDDTDQRCDPAADVLHELQTELVATTATT
jgi:hypothetical protein